MYPRHPFVGRLLTTHTWCPRKRNSRKRRRSNFGNRRDIPIKHGRTRIRVVIGRGRIYTRANVLYNAQCVVMLHESARKACICIGRTYVSFLRNVEYLMAVTPIFDLITRASRFILVLFIFTDSFGRRIVFKIDYKSYSYNLLYQTFTRVFTFAPVVFLFIRPL